MPTASTSRYPGDVDVTTNTTTYDYSEGLEVGYRWYQANNVTPLFPFGYGLTSSTFAYSNLDVQPAANATGQKVTVTAAATRCSDPPSWRCRCPMDGRRDR